jgi:hypothetical protein
MRRPSEEKARNSAAILRGPNQRLRTCWMSALCALVTLSPNYPDRYRPLPPVSPPRLTPGENTRSGVGGRSRIVTACGCVREMRDRQPKTVLAGPPKAALMRGSRVAASQSTILRSTIATRPSG